MPWQSPTWFSYDVLSVVASAPRKSGVYAIRNKEAWIYIGEAHDIQVRLLQHLNGDVPHIALERPTEFSFEPVRARDRVERQDALIEELRPLCNWPPELTVAA